jgi:hypothetical protein
MADTQRSISTAFEAPQGQRRAHESIVAASEEITSDKVKTLAGRGLKRPDLITLSQVQELCGSVLRHLQEERGVDVADLLDRT